HGVGSTNSVPAPPVGSRTLDHVAVVADRPQVHHVRGQPRETVVVTADLARLVAVDAPGEGDFAVLLEQRGVVEAGTAGDEAAADFVAGPARAAGGVQARGQQLDTGAVGLRLDRDDAPAPAHHRAGEVARGRFVRGDPGVLAAQGQRLGGAG